MSDWTDAILNTIKPVQTMELPRTAPAAIPGLKVPGNIDIYHRPVVQNPDGSISTVRSMSFGRDNNEILVPTATQGRILSGADAIRNYDRTGEHLGIFSKPDSATSYAEALHRQQAKLYGR